MRLGIGAFLIAWMSLPTFAANSNLEIPFDFLHNQIVSPVLLPHDFMAASRNLRLAWSGAAKMKKTWTEK